MKGIIFSGCSFTWGEGLHFYSDLSNVVYKKQQFFDARDYTDSHNSFVAANRFPRLVTQYFNSWEITNFYNGGTMNHNLENLKIKFGLTSFEKNSYNFNDVSALIFQITDIFRGPFYIFSKLKNEKIVIHQLDPNNRELTEQQKKDIYDLIDEYGWDEMMELIYKNWFEEIKKVTEIFEENNVVVKFICWQSEVADRFRKETYFKDRWIEFNYKGTKSFSIDELYPKNKAYCNASYFKKYKIQTNDLHPSLLGHQYIASQIIENLESDTKFINYHYKITNNSYEPLKPNII